MRQVLVELATVFLCPDGKLPHKDNHIFRLMGKFVQQVPLLKAQASQKRFNVRNRGWDPRRFELF